MAEQNLPAAPKTPTSNTTTASLPAPKTLTSAASLANLLPTGTVLAFEALMPSFSDDGACLITNKYLTAILIAFCTLTSFVSFTDSFTYRGKLYYGIATFKGLYMFNDDEREVKRKLDLSNYKIKARDYVHAFLSAFVFLVFALGNSNVQSCFIPKPGANHKVLIMNMPLGAGVLAGLLFSIFPTRRRGIGYADKAPDQALQYADKADHKVDKAPDQAHPAHGDLSPHEKC